VRDVLPELMCAVWEAGDTIDAGTAAGEVIARA
jgi:hypothetical protein